MLLAFRQRVKLIQQEFSFEDDAILSQLQLDLSSAIESPTTSKMTLLHSFITVSTCTYHCLACLTL